MHNHIGFLRIYAVIYDTVSYVLVGLLMVPHDACMQVLASCGPLRQFLRAWLYKLKAGLLVVL